MNLWTLDFSSIEANQLPLVGGKGANLGELSKIEGLLVPEGFCVTSAVFRQALESSENYPKLLNQLTELHEDDRPGIAGLTGQIRQVIEDAEIPPEAAAEIAERLARLGTTEAYAVRSSATAEDLPHASFAGQQDTYLNVIGLANILTQIRRCWASLFTERAAIYRIQHGFDHRQVALSVVVQRMVFPEASGILFTADPLTSDRRIVLIEAGFGLGEAMVSGILSPDRYKVRAGEIVETRIEAKTLSVEPNAEGGTETKALSEEKVRQRC